MTSKIFRDSKPETFKNVSKSGSVTEILDYHFNAMNSTSFLGKRPSPVKDENNPWGLPSEKRFKGDEQESQRAAYNPWETPSTLIQNNSGFG